MKAQSKEEKKTNRETKFNSFCCTSGLLLSVVCCIALIHVELKIQEHHRVISQSATFCGQMEKEILQKVRQNYEKWQINKGSNSDGTWHETQGKADQFRTPGGELLYVDYRSERARWDRSRMGDFFYQYYTCFSVGCQEMKNVKAELPIKKVLMYGAKTCSKLAETSPSPLVSSSYPSDQGSN